MNTLCLMTIMVISLVSVGNTADSIKSSSSDRILAGLLDVCDSTPYTNIDMKQVSKDGYNTVVFGYANVLGNNISFSESINPTTTLVNKLQQAHKYEMKTFVAVGGSPNTFKPGLSANTPEPTVLGRNMSDADIYTLAENIVSLIHKYKMQGIVFSLDKYISPNFILKLSKDLKDIDSGIVIIINPSVNDYQLVTSGKSKDYSLAIKAGVVDYIFIKEYGGFNQEDPGFISSSYNKIITENDIPLSTKIVIEEPTTSLIGGMNTIYHSKVGDNFAIKNDGRALKDFLNQLHEIKYKPRFAGVYGNSLNVDYFSELYGIKDHESGVFAKDLKECIYGNECGTVDNTINGHVIGGILPALGSSIASFNKASDNTSTSLDLELSNDMEFCDKNPNVCKYNMLFISYFKSSTNDSFVFDFNDKFDIDRVFYDKKKVKVFVDYMRNKGKKVVLSIGDQYSTINWQELDVEQLINFIEYYGFDGINFDLDINDIPKNDKDVTLASQKIKTLVYSVRSKDSDFILSFSPEWQHIVSPLDNSSNENIYNDERYISLVDMVGIKNISYLILDTYSDTNKYSIFGYKLKRGRNYEKISSAEGATKLLPALAWALTTTDGYNANKDKYSGDKSILIPSSKLIFLIPSTGDSQYNKQNVIISGRDVSEIVSNVEKTNASFGGFVIDYDYDEKNNPFSKNSTKHWSLVDSIISLKMPESVSQFIPAPQNKIKYSAQGSNRTNFNTLYPENINKYKTGTRVVYDGNSYECIVTEECRNITYTPNTLLGAHAWNNLGSLNSILAASEKQMQELKLQDEKKLEESQIPVYPKSIGSYTDGVIVESYNKLYMCDTTKVEFCNSEEYNPTGSKGYLAWTEIKEDDGEIMADQDTIYPDHITKYHGGTIVIAEGKKYMCIVGFSSVLCSNEKYSPLDYLGKEAWIEVKDTDKLVSNPSSGDVGGGSHAGYSYPEGISEYAAGTIVNMDGQAYMCKTGSVSALCKRKSFAPNSSRGNSVWLKV